MAQLVRTLSRPNRSSLPHHAAWQTDRPTAARPSQRSHDDQRRAIAADIATKISCHSFRAIGIITYLQNGGKLEVAQQSGARRGGAGGVLTRSCTKFYGSM